MKNILNTLAFTTVALALAFTANLSTATAAHAADAQGQMAGQMIDDSGLVISSNADGSLREFKLSEQELAALKIFNQTTVVLNAGEGRVLDTVIALSSMH